MGNFEKLSVLVIVVIIVLILIVAIYTWTDNPNNAATTDAGGSTNTASSPEEGLMKMGEANPDPSWADVFNEPGSETPMGEPSGDEPKIGEQPIIVTPGEDHDIPPMPGDNAGQDPAPEPAPAGSDEPWMYTIQANDTITEIAMRLLGTHRRSGEIMKMNPGLDPLRLRVGQQIKMPPKGVVAPSPIKTVVAGNTGTVKAGEFYVTRHGDTLEKISKAAFRTTDYWPEIWAKNLKVLNSPDEITAGMKLFIPNVVRHR